MHTAANQHCAHPACSCTVDSGDAYCSEHCRKRVESPTSDQTPTCQCGHAECDAAAAGELEHRNQAQRVPK
jgi:hypothetical protein